MHGALASNRMVQSEWLARLDSGCFDESMNRRNFIGGLLSAVAGFSILPPAETYSRIWRAVKPERLFLPKLEMQLKPPFPLVGAVVSTSCFDYPNFNGAWIHMGNGRCLKVPPLNNFVPC